MHRLGCLVVVGALAGAVSLVAAGPAGAAKGGNNDAAKQCRHGRWVTLVSQTGAPFKNQGDCVNDGAQGLGVGPQTPEEACLSLPGRPRFTDEGEGSWKCSYLTPPGPAQAPSSLERQCLLGNLDFRVDDGLATAECSPEGP